MNIVFMGTADFGLPTLELLRDNGYRLSAIVTVPDKPAGRGQKVLYSPVKRYALEHHLALLQPDNLKDPAFIQSLKSLQPDLFIVVAFRILPPGVFRIPTKGSFNLHASLLPKYRGAAPIQWAIINGETETGVTTFFLDEKIDTGTIILQEKIPIGINDTAGDIHDRLATIGAETVLQTVRMIESGTVNPYVQDNSGATPAPKIFREHCRIDWTKNAVQVHNFIRGLSPRPCAFTMHNGGIFKIYRSSVSPNGASKSPGEIVQDGSSLFVSTGDGMIEILELQQEGKKVLKAVEFLRGHEFTKGDRFE